jgi:methylglyoxal synthase
MAYNKKISMGQGKKIALVAHDNKKRDLLEWAKFNRDLLAHHEVYATGTTGEILRRELGFAITSLQSGPLGGDQQIGAKIVDNEVDFLIFFWDPLEPLPHDPDVKALLRMAVVWNIPIACNRASADFMISSPLMQLTYDRLVPDYDAYRGRKIEWGPSSAEAEAEAEAAITAKAVPVADGASQAEAAQSDGAVPAGEAGQEPSVVGEGAPSTEPAAAAA